MSRIKLKEMSFGDILDYTISMYKDNFLKLFVAIAMLSFPLTVLTNIVSKPTSPSKYWNIFKNSMDSGNSFNVQAFSSEMQKLRLEQVSSSSATSIAFILGILAFVASCIYIPAVYKIIHGYITGNEVSIKESFKTSPKKIFSLIGLKILSTLIMGAIMFGAIIVLGIAAIVMAVLIGALKSNTVLVIIIGVIVALTAILLVAGVYAYIFAFDYFSTTSFLIEENRVMESIGRGFSMASFKIIRYVFAMVLMVLIMVVPWFIMLIVSNLIGAKLGSDLVTYILTTLVGIVFEPIMYILFTVLLYDYKVRKEGFDIKQNFNDLLNNEG